MKEYTLQTEVWRPRPRDEVFAFFGDARNLDALTPPWVKFAMLTPGFIEMRAGTLIDYRIRVLLRCPDGSLAIEMNRLNRVPAGSAKARLACAAVNTRHLKTGT